MTGLERWLLDVAVSESAELLDLPHVVFMDDPLTGEVSVTGPFDSPVEAARFVEEMSAALADGFEMPAFRVLPLCSVEH